jgi:hypothetical protein
LYEANWEQATELVTRRLDVGIASPYAPWISYGNDLPRTFQHLTRAELARRPLEAIAAEALAELRARNVEWTALPVPLPSGRTMQILVLEDEYAAEHVLDPIALGTAQRQLGAKALAVGISRRGALFATSCDHPEDELRSFFAAIDKQFQRAETKTITPLILCVVDGEIVGWLDRGTPAPQAAPDETQVAFIRVSSPTTYFLAMIVGGPDFPALARRAQRELFAALETAQRDTTFSGRVELHVNEPITPAHVAERFGERRCDLASTARARGRASSRSRMTTAIQAASRS